MLEIIRRFLFGPKKGETRLVKASPYIVGPLGLLLPSDLRTDTERRQIRYCFNEQQWNGRKWVFVARRELSKSELIEFLKKENFE